MGMFEIVYTGAGPFMDLIEEALLFWEFVRPFLGNGIVALLLLTALLPVWVRTGFLPQIMLLFFMISILESSGYGKSSHNGRFMNLLV